MANDPDYGAMMDQQSAHAAYGAIAGTQGVSPEQAATGIQSGPVAGLPPSVAMRTPDEARQQADAVRQQQVLQQHPAVAQWVAGADPAHVAAAKDSLPGLAAVATKQMQSPWMPKDQSVLGGIGEMIAGQFKAGAEEYKQAQAQRKQGGVANWFGGLYHALEAGVGGATAPIAPVVNAAGDTYWHWAIDAGNTPEQATALTSTFLNDLMLGDAVPGIHAGGALADPLVGGRGGKPEGDAIRSAVAQVDAVKAGELQDTIASTAVHGRSPETVADFMRQQVSDRTVHVDPDALIEHVLGQGHELPFPELGPQLAGAVANGDLLEVPYERYHTAVAGQPYAEALNANTIFREGGMTLEDAKTVGKGEEPEATLSKPATELPDDLTPEEGNRVRTLAAKAEDAVEQVMREQYMSPVPINHAGDIGMTAQELERYGDEMRAASEEARSRAVDAAVRQIRREREPDWKEAVAKHTEDARAEIEGRRSVATYRALSEDGNHLDSDILKAAYPDLEARLPNAVKGKLGLIPDDFAELLGYDSGREMMNDLAFTHQAVRDTGARNLDDYVDKQSKAIGQSRAEAQLGEGFFTPEAMRELAQKLVPEDRATGTLIDEWRYLAKLAGQDGIRLDDIKAQTVQSFDGQRVADVTNTQRLNDRIYRLAQKAQQALAKDQFGAAFGYKQLQFQRRLQLKQALKFRREFDQAVKQWGRLAGNRTLAGMEQTALNYIHSILAEAGYRVASHPDDLPPISQLPQYVDSRNQLGAEVLYSDVPQADPGKPLGKNLGNMTTAEFRGLRDMISSIAKDGRNQQTVIRQGKAVAAEAVRSATIDSLNRYTRDISREELNNPTLVQKLDATRRGWDAALVRMEQLLLDFTGRDPDHPLMDIWHRLQEGKGWKDDKLIELADHFKQLGKQLGKGFDDWLETRVGNAAEGTGYLPPTTHTRDPIFITNKDITVAAAHMGDAQALAKFAAGYDTTPAAIEAIVHKHMTDDAWTYVQGLWDGFGRMTKDTQEAYLRRSGVHLQMVEPRPFEVPAGVRATEGRKIAGGYYPIQYDFDNLPQAQKMMLQSDEVLGAKEFRTFLPSSNYMKARTKFAAPIDMSLDMVYTRLRQMAHDLAFRDPLVDFQKVLLHPDVVDAINTKYGPEYVNTIREHIKAVAGQETGGGSGMRTLTNFINYLSNAQQISLIGFNPGTVLKHGGTAMFHSMQTVGPLNFLRASTDLIRQLPDGILKKLDTESSELRYRNLNANEKARESFEQLQGADNWRAKLQRASVYAISELDKWSARQVYMAAKQAELDRQVGAGLPIDEQQAIRLGDQAVRQAHGSTGTLDTAQVLRSDNSLFGTLASSETRFLNFLNHNYNRMREIGQAFGYAGEDMDVSRGLGLLLTYGIITGGIGALTAGEFKAAKGGIDWAKGIAGTVGHVTLDSLPILQNITGAAGWVAGGQKGLPRGGMLMQFGFMYGLVGRDIAQVMSDKNGGPSHRRHVEHLIADATNAVGTTFQLPAGAVAKIQRFAFQHLDPQANPKRNH